MKYQPLQYIKNFQKKLYFLSTKNFDGKEIHPRIPHTRLKGAEDGTTKRICCSSSISGAYRSIETIGRYQEMFVHTIENVEDIVKSGNLIKPTIDRVEDVNRTDEYWVTCPVTLKCIGKVNIGYDAFSQKLGTPEEDHVHFKYIEKYNDDLYESIVTAIQVGLNNALNEESKLEKLAAGDHSRIQIVQIKPLQLELIKKGYKCTLLNPSVKVGKKANCDMILHRNNDEVSYVKIYRRRRSTKSDVIMLPIGKFDNKNTVFDDDQINEICIICPPQLNSDPYGRVIDNTKACFFDKDVLLNAYVNGELKARTTREGDSIVIPERWAKDNAKEVISYKYTGSSKNAIIENLKFDFNNSLNEKQQISKWIEEHFDLKKRKNNIDKAIDMYFYVPKDRTGNSEFFTADGKPTSLMRFFRDHEITKFVGISIGFSEKEQKWYGWSHRAIHGFGIGDEAVELYPGETKKGKKCKTIEDCKKAAKAFAESVS